jgi:LacI family transcriptional regulator
MHIVSRLSTDVLAIEDREIAIALNYIRYHTRKGDIHVEDVVNQTTLSRRVLEKRFRKVLNCSINAKIRQFRLEHFCKLLVESTLSVTEIASDMGFMEIKHVPTYFQKAIGMTPLKYRKKHCNQNL